MVLFVVLRIRIRDLGSGAFLTFGSGMRGMEKIRLLDLGFGLNILSRAY